MQYVSLLMRWSCEPECHINFNPSRAKCYHINRWTYINVDNICQHLTVVCAQLESGDVAAFVTDTLKLMTTLWSKPNDPKIIWPKITRSVDLDNCLKGQHFVCGAHQYSIIRTEIKPSDTFYQHINNTNCLLTSLGWQRGTDYPIAADKDTTFRLHCNHADHTVYVLHSEKGMSKVTCREPQLIYDLFRKSAAFHCSNVWNDKIALSARAPCVALIEHNMQFVRANRIPCSDEMFMKKESDFTTLYQNMASLKLSIGGAARCYRHKPNALVQTKQDISVLPTGGDDDDDISEIQIIENSLPAVVYFGDPSLSLSEILKEDGRFVPNFTLNLKDRDSTDVDVKYRPMQYLSGQEELVFYGEDE